MLLSLAIAVVAAAVAFTVTALVRRNAVRLGVVQAPNARSSHTVPTPSGGGVGIVAGGSIVLAVAATRAPFPALWLLIIAGAIAAVGFVDDRRPLPALFRLPVQLGLVAIAIVVAVPFEALASQIGLPAPALFLGAVALIAAVYWINIFNFMDGIDGIAAAQAMFMLLGALLLLLLRDPDALGGGAGAMLIGLAGATLGFLALNWPPAKIFMGDAGSTYLGFLLALMALSTIADGLLSLPQWLILGALFVVDASVTLLRRLLNRERIFEAHRRHAYQALSRRFGRHLPVTLGFAGLNLVALLPMAMLAGLPGWAWPAAAITYVPLVIAALLLGAGAPERPAAARG
jgi:Fuc2NAc and GlcNAc transferase